MKHPILKISVVLFFLFCQQPISAQMTEEDYKKAEYFLFYSLQKEIYHLEVIPSWSNDGNSFWHVTYTKDGKRFFTTSLTDESTTETFDHEALAGLLADQSGEKIDSKELPINRIQINSDTAISFEWRNKIWTFNKTKSTLTSETKKQEEERKSSVSPDGNWRAFTKNFNLYVENLQTGEEAQLSFDGKQDFEYASFYGWGDIIEGENGVRPPHFFVSWSPDSKKILTQIVDLRLAEKMYLLDFSKEEKFRPDLLSYYRGSPGDTTVVTYTPVIFDLETKKNHVFTEYKSPHFMPFSLSWEESGENLWGFYFPRGFKKYDLLEIDAKSFKVRKVYSEESDTHIDRDNLFQRLSNGRFILSSQKSGWNHLYLYDWNSGKLIRQLTSGQFVVTNILHVDESDQKLYFEASGKENGRNVYYPHLYKVNLDGSQLELLTPENAYHEIYISKNKDYFVDNYSTVDQPTKSVLREISTGKIIKEISTADISNLTARGYKSPKQFSAIGKDGKTEIYGVYFLPTDFDPEKTYPVIDYTYSGPHTANTPKTFKAGLFGLQQPMAEFGFAVVTVDGLGTAGRSKAFADVSYRNLGDGTTDHVLAIKQLAEKVSFLDIDRVGIFGHSAGGYDAARAMLLHPDFYKVGVASAGDHDHRMEKAWWPEMYMGYPVGEYYHVQSNITNAANLKGRLLLAHGAIDENVNPSATYKFAEALINAGKDFDLFIWPSRNHSFGRASGDYFTKKRWDYFIEHLLGEKPLLHYKLDTGN